jgi:hypothetical protein
LAIDIASGADIDSIESFKETNGYAFFFGTTTPSTLLDYHVSRQATKVAIDKNGVIVFREGYGLLNDTEWLNIFDMLTTPE